MSREDGLWLAYRCTGLLLIAAAILLVPQLMSVVTIYTSIEPLHITGDFAALSVRSDAALKGVLIQAILQVALPAIAGLLFLFGFRWPSARRAKTVAGQVLRGEI